MKYIPLDETLSSRELLALRDYWLRIRGDRRMPSRADFDPLDIPKLLRFLTIAQVYHDPLRFRYRLIGTAITKTAGRDMTGKWIDKALYGDRLQAIERPYKLCAESRQPLAMRREVQFVFKEWINIEFIMLPLGENPDRPDFVVSGIVEVKEDIDVPPLGTSYQLLWDKGAAS